MGGLFSDSQRSTTNSNGTSTGTSVGNLFPDQRFQDAYDLFSNTFTPERLQEARQVNPLQTAAGTNQAGVAPGLQPVQSAALNIGQTGISPDAIEAYRNQYAQMAIDPTISAYDTLRKNAISSLHGDAAAQGALGNSNNAQAEAIWDANNQPGIRRDIANLENQGYMTAANTAAQSTGYQVSGLGAATAAGQAQTGANQVQANIGEQARLADLTDTNLAEQALRGQSVPGLIAGNTSQTTQTGSQTTEGSQTPSLASTILGGVGTALSFARDGGAITDDRQGFPFGGDVGFEDGGDYTIGGMDNYGSGNLDYDPGAAGVFSGGYGDDQMVGGGVYGHDDLSQATPQIGGGAQNAYGQTASDTKAWPTPGPTREGPFVPPPRDPNATPPVAAKDPNWTATVKENRDIFGMDSQKLARAAQNAQKALQPKNPPPKENTSLLERQQEEARRQIAQMQGNFAGLASYNRAEGGPVPIHEKVKQAHALFESLKNGGAAGYNGGGDAQQPEDGVPSDNIINRKNLGVSVGDVPENLPERQAYTKYYEPFEAFNQIKKGQLAGAPQDFSTPPPAPPPPPTTTGSIEPQPSAAARGVPPTPEAGGVRGFLGKVLPGLNEGVWVGKPMTPMQKFGAALAGGVKSPRWNATFSGVGEALQNFEQNRLKQLELDQNAGRMIGEIRTADGVRQTLEGARNPAQIQALEAQGSNEQIRRQGIENANKLYAQQLQNITDQQMVDKDGYTPHKQAYYEGLREQAQAQLRAEIMRYDNLSAGGGSGARVAPGAPAPPKPRVRNESELYGRP